MSRRPFLRALLGFVLALAVLVGFVTAVGVEHVLDELAGADFRYVLAGAAAAVGATLCWSEAQRHALAAAGGHGGLRFRLAYFAGDFAKQTLPMGHVSGPAIMAYGVAEAAGVAYEEALGAITVSDLANLLASAALAALGVVGFLALGHTDIARSGMIAVAVVAVGVALIAVLAFRGRSTLTWTVVGLASLSHRLRARFRPRSTPPFEPAAVTSHVAAYFGTLDAAVADRDALVRIGVFALAGWILFVLPLVAAGAALGGSVPLAVALFVVPLAGLATWLPLPGGVGGVELAVAGALVAVAGFEPAAAAATALVYRLCSYWAVVAVDGLAGAAFLRFGSG